MSIEEKFGNDIIVLGMGSKGALMYVKEENEFYELPAVNVKEVVNTVGAGDALFSSFIHFYAKGLKPIDCLKRAEVFAAYKIGFDGASVGFPDEETVEKLTMKNVADERFKNNIDKHADGTAEFVRKAIETYCK